MVGRNGAGEARWGVRIEEAGEAGERWQGQRVSAHLLIFLGVGRARLRIEHPHAGDPPLLELLGRLAWPPLLHPRHRALCVQELVDRRARLKAVYFVRIVLYAPREGGSGVGAAWSWRRRAGGALGLGFGLGLAGTQLVGGRVEGRCWWTSGAAQRHASS